MEKYDRHNKEEINSDKPGFNERKIVDAIKELAYLIKDIPIDDLLSLIRRESETNPDFVKNLRLLAISPFASRGEIKDDE